MNNKLQECREEVAKVINEYVKTFGFDEIKSTGDIVGFLEEKCELHGWFLVSDMCYNKTNKANLGTYVEDVKLFEEVSRGKYRILGENYPYSGDLIWKKKKGKPEVVGKWDNGKLNYWGDKFLE